MVPATDELCCSRHALVVVGDRDGEGPEAVASVGEQTVWFSFVTRSALT
jgi:hypothetical protein